MSRLVRYLKAVIEEEEELEIPACGGATRILLKPDKRWRLRLPAAGLFAALTLLSIESGRIEGSELTALVSTQCPRLKTLLLAVTLCTVSDVSMRMDSLEVLFFHAANTRCLEIVAPRMEQLNMNPCPQSCLCRLAKSSKIDDITLGSLEEVEINNFTSSQEELEFLEKLSRCNAAALKKIVICYTRRPLTPLTKEMCEKQLTESAL
ncbi:hypothetical protein EJB05_57603, partial [Eragrostis curvula]